MLKLLETKEDWSREIDAPFNFFENERHLTMEEAEAVIRLCYETLPEREDVVQQAN